MLIRLRLLRYSKENANAALQFFQRAFQREHHGHAIQRRYSGMPVPVGWRVKLADGFVMKPVDAHFVRLFLMVVALYTVWGLTGPCTDVAAVGAALAFWDSAGEELVGVELAV